MIKERIWNDPVTDDPQQSGDRYWRIKFIGITNILAGVILYIVINYSEIPVSAIPSIFLCVGGVFCIYGGYMWYRSVKS